LIFSLGIDPSTTKMKGMPSVPSRARKNGSRKSPWPPPRLGDSTLLWRWTFGIPGTAPMRISSSDG